MPGIVKIKEKQTIHEGRFDCVTLILKGGVLQPDRNCILKVVHILCSVRGGSVAPACVSF
jgi:hypothetical protein